MNLRSRWTIRIKGAFYVLRGRPVIIHTNIVGNPTGGVTIARAEDRNGDKVPLMFANNTIGYPKAVVVGAGGGGVGTGRRLPPVVTID